MTTPPAADQPLKQSGNGVWVPCATAFIASACVMIVELLAFRLVTRYLGNSNYTTTAIIGVVLGGLALGNYVGGRIADRYRSDTALATLFVLASAGCFAIPMLNALIGEWAALWFLSWPVRISIHVFLSFFIPCALMGTIGPVVAKMALDRGRAVGRTVGGVYAWGVLGSLLGTFASGFILIPRYGLFTINHVVAALLAIMGILFAGRRLLPYGWAAATCILLVIIFGLPFGSQEAWARSRAWASDWGLRDDEGPHVLFDKASEYSQVRVEEMPRTNGRRVMLLDKLAHSFFEPSRPNELEYGYERVFGGTREQFTKTDEAFSVLILGGGGFTHPRNLLRERPNARAEVVEIDPVVTEAAMAQFDLAPDPRMTIIHMDARQHVIALTRDNGDGKPPPTFKLIFLDALNDFVVPPHLTTLEFTQSIKRLLDPNGAFLMNMVEIQDEGVFLGSVVKTLRNSFAHVNVYIASDDDGSAQLDPRERYTFVVVASDIPPPAPETETDLTRYLKARRMPDAGVEELVGRAGVQLLTDDSAPVEAMLANLPIRSARGDATARFHNRGNRATAEGQFEKALREYGRALELDPKFVLARLNMGMAQVEQAARVVKEIRTARESAQPNSAEIERLSEKWRGLYEGAAHAFEGVLEVEPNYVAALFNLAQVRQVQQRFEAALPYYERCMAVSPNHVDARYGMALCLANLGRLADAKTALEDVLKRQPNHPTARQHLTRIESSLATSKPVDTDS